VTGVPWTTEDRWDSDLLAESLASLLASEEAWRAASVRIHQAARDDAAATVARTCLALIRNGAFARNPAP
jgi:hypothetical protein